MCSVSASSSSHNRHTSRMCICKVIEAGLHANMQHASVNECVGGLLAKDHKKLQKGGRAAQSLHTQGWRVPLSFCVN